MSKKFKGKKCVYCAEATSDTGDHVFAREFFLIEKRQNLPKVPSCNQCNNFKSTLEHSLAALLPFGGRHNDAKNNLKEMVPKRLFKNKKLHKELNQKQSYIWLKRPSGIHRPSMTLPVNFNEISKLFHFIVKGLTYYHFNTYLPSDIEIEVLALTPFGEDFFEKKFFSLNSKARVIENLAEGTFWYEGVQGVDCPQITAWRFSVYNGLQLTEQNAPYETASLIGAFSGPKTIFDKVDYK